MSNQIFYLQTIMIVRHENKWRRKTTYLSRDRKKKRERGRRGEDEGGTGQGEAQWQVSGAARVGRGG